MKVHLYEDNDPMYMPKALTAVCGKFVSPVAVVWMRDGEVFDRMLVNTSIFCKRCFEATLLNKRYLYGIVNAQELKTEE